MARAPSQMAKIMLNNRLAYLSCKNPESVTVKVICDLKKFIQIKIFLGNSAPLYFGTLQDYSLLNKKRFF